MKHLLYCIFEADGVVLPEGWGVRVDLLHARGLSVAFSRSESVEALPPVEKLLEFERVVAWLHGRRSVIPLRYGNVVDSEGAMVELLARRAKEFRELLAKLDGRTEIGVRVLLAGPPAKLLVCSKPAGGASPGTAYLNSLRERFERDNGLNQAESGLVERVRESVRHLHAELASEIHCLPDGRLLSLYLLLPKENVDECRRALVPFLEDPSLKTLVTGPWPPYHYAASREAAHG